MKLAKKNAEENWILLDIKKIDETLDKYEYWTGEDLGLKPSTIEQGLSDNDKKQGLFKTLKKYWRQD